ncbi:MAG: nascent polypeptide-associated complex protein [Nanoarchaeota archaeon]|nr:nascent polypeptide-associated complex protein [Nanoarchaeota archaeon]
MFNPNQMRKLMKQMNMQQVDADRVEIFSGSKKIVIDNPDITKMKVMGEEMYQIKGEAREVKDLPSEDVELVSKQSGVGLDEARVALENANGDLVEAIELLKK